MQLIVGLAYSSEADVRVLTFRSVDIEVVHVISTTHRLRFLFSVVIDDALHNAIMCLWVNYTYHCKTELGFAFGGLVSVVKYT